nr:MAG TPA: hypothetical protein [Caudoviricetes sp.]
MKVLHGLFSLTHLIFSLRAESRVSKVLKVKKVTRATKVYKVSKDHKVSKVLKASRVSKAPRATRETKAIKVTRSLGTKSQHRRAKNSKVKKVTKAILVILVSITVQLNLKSIKRNWFGLTLQKKNQLPQSTSLTFLAFKRNSILKSNFQPKSQKELNSSQS